MVNKSTRKNKQLKTKRAKAAIKNEAKNTKKRKEKKF